MCSIFSLMRATIYVVTGNGVLFSPTKVGGAVHQFGRGLESGYLFSHCFFNDGCLCHDYRSLPYRKNDGRHDGREIASSKLTTMGYPTTFCDTITCMEG